MDCNFIMHPICWDCSLEGEVFSMNCSLKKLQKRSQFKKYLHAVPGLTEPEEANLNLGLLRQTLC